MKQPRETLSLVKILMAVVVCTLCSVTLDVSDCSASSSQVAPPYNYGYPQPATTVVVPPTYPFSNPIPTALTQSPFKQLPQAPQVGGSGPSDNGATGAAYARQRSMSTSSWTRKSGTNIPRR